MENFRPVSSAYRYASPADGGRSIVLVPVNEVEPLQRTLSHGVFNDSPETGTARERVTRLLRGFRDDVPIPPIELDRLGPHAYRLFHGAHRFYCSLAAGFTHVPAIIYEQSEWKRSR